MLSIATCAESTHATMDEEGAKVDLKLSLRHAHLESTLLTIHCQVKSGPSYHAASSNASQVTLRVDRETLVALSQGNLPALLLWVPPKPSSRAYWHLVRSRTLPKTPVRIPTIHSVTPSLRYDLGKAASFIAAHRRYPLVQLADVPETELLRLAKAAYKALKLAKVKHPLTGNTMVTRLAWRHILRRGRDVKKRKASLRVAPYLGLLLERMPTRYIVANELRHSFQRTVVDQRDVICWYSNAIEVDGKRRTVLVRIREEIRYPRTWFKYPLSAGDIVQQATISGWWYK